MFNQAAQCEAISVKALLNENSLWNFLPNVMLPIVSRSLGGCCLCHKLASWVVMRTLLHCFYSKGNIPDLYLRNTIAL